MIIVPFAREYCREKRWTFLDFAVPRCDVQSLYLVVMGGSSGSCMWTIHLWLTRSLLPLFMVFSKLLQLSFISWRISETLGLPFSLPGLFPNSHLSPVPLMHRVCLPVPPDSFALLLFAHHSFDLTFFSCNHQVCRGYLFCLGTYWTASTEHTFCYFVGWTAPLDTETSCSSSLPLTLSLGRPDLTSDATSPPFTTMDFGFHVAPSIVPHFW